MSGPTKSERSSREGPQLSHLNKNLVEDRRDWGRTRRDQETRYGTYIVSLRTACRRPESSTLETTWGPLPRKLESSTLEMTWGPLPRKLESLTLEMTWGPLPRKLEFWTLGSSTLENIAGPFPSDAHSSFSGFRLARRAYSTYVAVRRYMTRGGARRGDRAGS